MSTNEGELGGLDTPVPHRGDEEGEVLDTVAGFEKECRAEHARLKHAGEFETCEEEACVDARDLLANRNPKA